MTQTTGSSAGQTTYDVASYALPIAEGVVGLGANPANPTSAASYLAFIAPGETANTQASMAEMSGCGLTVAGIWRASGVDSSALYPPYVTGTAISRLMSIADAAGAWVPYSSSLAPVPGDMVLLDESGADTHVYTVITITPTSTGYALTSVDGGQIDEQDFETILLKSRTWSGSNDTVAAQGADGASTRTINGWVSLANLPLLAAPPLWGYVQNGPSDSQGFDTDTVLTTTSAPGLVAAGYCFCIRYLSLQSPGKAGDLTLSEAGIILAAKLGLMAVQHVDAYGWTPTAALGVVAVNSEALASNDRATAEAGTIAAGSNSALIQPTISRKGRPGTVSFCPSQARLFARMVSKLLSSRCPPSTLLI